MASTTAPVVDPARRAKVEAALSKYEGVGTAQTTEFPSLMICHDKLIPQGSFAERQAEFLAPRREEVVALANAFNSHHIGIVSHFYMDASIQGLLTAVSAFEAESGILAGGSVYIADSLAMGDAAIRMAKAGKRVILCLGVDFMSENCRAVLDMNGFPNVPVFRLCLDPIGCSLATAAEKDTYFEWLSTEAQQHPNSAHVVYINTSLLTKAKAHAIVPTITCTSSNVVETILELSAESPTAHILYGPDSYMGKNLQTLFKHISQSPEEVSTQLHPKHTRETIRNLVENQFHFYNGGYCLVHHMFGSEVVNRIKSMYITGSESDAFCAAHLEVPGEMFEIAIQQQAQGKGVVGSTSNILDFITKKTEEAIAAGTPSKIRCILGTESGMTTSIVRRVQSILKKRPESGVAVEIIFPVSSQAITTSDDPSLPVIPGVSCGEGCSLAGGCASCPFMKMNTLEALKDMVNKIANGDLSTLERYKPNNYSGLMVGSQPVVALGTIPIEYMRAFQHSHHMPPAMIQRVTSGSH
ncbi:Quinolinate synthase A [Pelomyxa schiedti]|nr:Quinolinate synthase A [Pelomyxa schiedti]